MLTREEDIEAHALYSSGWTISAIARHLGRDRKTIRAYVTGARAPGVRARPGPDAFEAFAEYARARLGEDPHLWVTTLADELEELGWSGGYSTLTRQIRRRGLRPVCEQCRSLTDRPVAIIDHPPGAETQWDWLELPDPPAHWGWGRTAHLLVGASSHSGAWGGVLVESEDQAHLVAGLHQVAERLGGLTRAWRFDRMATVADPGSGRVSASFAAVAKHYAVVVEVCPPRRGNRKGVVEKANHAAAQRIWRAMPETIDGTPITVAQAQARIDTWCTTKGDARRRVVLDPDGTHRPTTVGDLAAAEPLRVLPAPFPVSIQVARTVTAQALVAYDGNFYSVPPTLARAKVLVTAVTAGRTCRSPPRTPPRPSWPGTASWPPAPAPLQAVKATPRRRAEHRRDERRRNGAPAPPQGPDPTRTASPGRGRRPAPPPHRRRRRCRRGCRDRHGGLRTRRPRKEHPHVSTTDPMTTSQASLYQQLRAHLAALKLTTAAEHLPAVLDAAAAQGLSLTVALERLLAAEVDATEARRLAGRLRFASLPSPATVEDFDFDAAAGVDPALIRELATCRYLDSATNVLLIGPPGVGKTHCETRGGGPAGLPGAGVAGSVLVAATDSKSH